MQMKWGPRPIAGELWKAGAGSSVTCYVDFNYEIFFVLKEKHCLTMIK